MNFRGYSGNLRVLFWFLRRAGRVECTGRPVRRCADSLDIILGMAASSAVPPKAVGDADRTRLFDHALRAALGYLNTVDERPVAPAPAQVAALDQLCGPVPEEPTDADAVLSLLETVASPATIANGGGRYFGFVNGG